MKQYGVILADPPWQYNNSGISGAAQRHYPTMPVGDICDLPIGEKAAPSSLLLLWATWPLLEDAFQVIKAWGFKYKTGLPWIKMKGIPTYDLWGQLVMRPYPGQGWWVRGASEALLIAVRGDISYPPDPPVGLISKRMQHSKKPENAHDYGQLFPGPYLELFARRQYSGWDVWGNEVENNVELPGLEEGDEPDNYDRVPEDGL